MSSLPVDLFKQAVYESDDVRLRQLLRDHPELKSQLNEPLFHFDSPAIVQAAARGSQNVIDALIGAGADVNARSQWWAGGFGVLDSANPEMSAYLIQMGATVDAHAASRLGMIEKLRELVSAQPDLVHARGGDGKTPLHFAATVEIAEYLLSQGAGIDTLDLDHESTPAQHLVDSHPDVVRYVIRRGCRTDILMAAAVGDERLIDEHLRDNPENIRMRVSEKYFPKRNPRSGGSIYIWTLGGNLSAHQVARKFGQENVVKQLMGRSPAEVRLVNAFADRDEEAIEGLLADHPDLIQSLSAEDRAQIAYAAQSSDIAAVRLMLKYKWPVDGGINETALHWAAFHGNADMAREILKHNPPIEQTDLTYQGTPLGWAIHGSEHGWHCKTGDYAGVVEALLQAGSKPPTSTGGSDAVRDVLRRHGVQPSG